MISVNPRKVYCIDHALATSVSSGIFANRISLMENRVVTALRRVTPEIFYHTWRTDETILVGFGTIQVVQFWQFLLKMDSRT